MIDMKQRCEKCLCVWNSDQEVDCKRHEFLCYLSTQVQAWTTQKPQQAAMVHCFVLYLPMASVLTLANHFLKLTFGWTSDLFEFDRLIDFRLNEDFFPPGTEFPLPDIFGGVYQGPDATTRLEADRERYNDGFLDHPELLPSHLRGTAERVRLRRQRADERYYRKKREAQLKAEWRRPKPPPPPKRRQPESNPAAPDKFTNVDVKLKFKKVSKGLRIEDCYSHRYFLNPEPARGHRVAPHMTLEELEFTQTAPMISFWAFEHSAFLISL